MESSNDYKELIELLKKNDKPHQLTYLTYLLGVKTGKELSQNENNKAS